jgi:hypothetical protein
MAVLLAATTAAAAAPVSAAPPDALAAARDARRSAQVSAGALGPRVVRSASTGREFSEGLRRPQPDDFGNMRVEIRADGPHRICFAPRTSTS